MRSMYYRTEDIIDKCIEGNAPRDVLRSLEEEYVDAFEVRDYLLKDLASSGVHREDVEAYGTTIKITTTESTNKDDLLSICDNYSRVYTEIEIFIS